MSNGDVWTATITYSNNNLTVQVQDGNSAADTLISNFNADIASILGSNTAYAGFTGSTGGGYENQNILNWHLTNDLPKNPSGVPVPGAVWLFGSGLILFALNRRDRGNRNV